MSRSKTSAIVALFMLLIGLPVSAALAQEAAAPAGVKGEMLMWYKDAESKLIQLAEATPEEKYAWRPNKDVRSTGEVFMHVVATNYGIPTFWGMKAPTGFDFATYEKSLTKKADIVQALKASFASMEQGFLATSDADLDKPAEFFGMKTTVRGGYLLLLSHSHEHLGQSIAYARSNGIVPPWTAKQMEAAKAAEEKKKAETK
jgi:uncharacterized damage-inducible protein DinB